VIFHFAIHPSVATAIAGVFAIFANKIDKITEKLEDVDKVKNRGVSLIGPDVAVLFEWLCKQLSYPKTIYRLFSMFYYATHT
jgi:hypothetical protein